MKTTPNKAINAVMNLVAIGDIGNTEGRRLVETICAKEGIAIV